MASTKTTDKFSDRIRFNWGYHDAAAAVRNGWDCPEHNFGFANHGPLAGLTSPEDVATRHFDAAYAQGWVAGYQDTKAGMYRNDSGPAWRATVKAAAK